LVSQLGDIFIINVLDPDRQSSTTMLIPRHLVALKDLLEKKRLE
jgi:hypothetical protein